MGTVSIGAKHDIIQERVVLGNDVSVCHGCVSRDGQPARLTQPWHTVTQA
jgi:hypothetical protein